MQDDPGPYFDVTCSKGHTSRFDKRDECRRNQVQQRGERGKDELILKCQARGCGEEMAVEIDCGGYRYL